MRAASESEACDCMGCDGRLWDPEISEEEVSVILGWWEGQEGGLGKNPVRDRFVRAIRDKCREELVNYRIPSGYAAAAIWGYRSAKLGQQVLTGASVGGEGKKP